MIKRLFLVLNVLVIVFIASIMLLGCSEQKSVQSVQSVQDSDQQDQHTQPDEDLQGSDQVVCATDVEECPDGSFVSRDANKGCEFKSCPEPEAELLPEEVIALQSKISTLQSYEYLDSMTNQNVLIKGDKIVLMTSNPNEFKTGGRNYNAIFIDNSAKTAYAACIQDTARRNTFQCADNSRKYTEVDYEEYLPDDPFKHLRELSNVDMKDSQNCERRDCDVFEYTLDGQRYKMMVRSFYVLPYKISKLDSDGTEELVVSYTNAAFNELKDSDMEVPSNFELVE